MIKLCQCGFRLFIYQNVIINSKKTKVYDYMKYNIQKVIQSPMEMENVYKCKKMYINVNTCI